MDISNALKSRWSSWLKWQTRPKNNSADRAEKVGRPVQLVIQEKVPYEANIGTYTYITPKEKEAEGTIEVVIPAQSEWKEEAAFNKKPVGYLVLSNCEATEWGERLESGKTTGEIPVILSQMDKNYRSSIKFDYKIKPQAGVIPAQAVFLEAEIVDGASEDKLQKGEGSFLDALRLQLKISSEVNLFSLQDIEQMTDKEVKEQIEELQNQMEREAKRKRREQAEENDKNREISEALEKVKEKRSKFEELRRIRQKNFVKQWDFFEKISDLWTSPSTKKLANDMLCKVKLAYVEIKTPYLQHFIPARSGWEGDEETARWHYNPQRNSLELRAKPLLWNAENYLYETQLYLDIDSPVNDLPVLQGTLILQFDEAISQLAVDWVSKESAEVDRNVKKTHRTWLILDFTIDLVEVFSNRLFEAHRHLHFEGIVFQDNHLANIRHILSNHRLTVLPDAANAARDQRFDQQNDPLAPSATIFAVQQGAYDNLLVAKVRGQMKEGEHTITYNNGQEKLTRKISLGSLNIDLQAKMSGKSDKVNTLLDQIQMDLEQYFTSVAATNVEGF